MAIDVIIPGTTPWVFSNAALAPGETVETAKDLNSIHMAVAEMASRGYIAGAQLKQAAADVNADKERLALLQDFQAGRIDLSTTAKATAATRLLTELGVDMSPYPRMATATGQRIVGQLPLYSLEGGKTLQIAYPPIPRPALIDQSQIINADASVISPVFSEPNGDLFYLAYIPNGYPSFATVPIDKNTVTDIRLSGLTTQQSQTILSKLDPAVLDAEIEKTIQISQGKQTYLQTLTTDYSTFMTTASNLLQEYYKVLTSMLQRIG